MPPGPGPGEDVADRSVSLDRLRERPLGVFATPFVYPLELVEPEAQDLLSPHHVCVDCVEDVREQFGGTSRRPKPNLTDGKTPGSVLGIISTVALTLSAIRPSVSRHDEPASRCDCVL